MNDTIIAAIDEAGALFPIEKLEAHRRGQHHLAISVFVFRGDELLLQRRAAHKYHSAGLWANTCCSHPAWGESVEACATRRLHEELGLRLPLRAASVLDYSADVGGGLTENERVHYFVGDYPLDSSIADDISPDPDEVAEVRWMTVGDLRRAVDANPAAYAPWLRIYLQRARETGIERLLPR
nr:isopentenyl-diphosphate Delta-isomerase [uncultured Halomonas sp.]